MNKYFVGDLIIFSTSLLDSSVGFRQIYQVRKYFEDKATDMAFICTHKIRALSGFKLLRSFSCCSLKIRHHATVNFGGLENSSTITKRVFLTRQIPLINAELWKSGFAVSNSQLRDPFACPKELPEMPGPRNFPLIGTSWIYSMFGPYNRHTFHIADEGNYTFTFYSSTSNMFQLYHYILLYVTIISRKKMIGIKYSVNKRTTAYIWKGYSSSRTEEHVNLEN